MLSGILLFRSLMCQYTLTQTASEHPLRNLVCVLWNITGTFTAINPICIQAARGHERQQSTAVRQRRFLKSRLLDRLGEQRRVGQRGRAAEAK